MILECIGKHSGTQVPPHTDGGLWCGSPRSSSSPWACPCMTFNTAVYIVTRCLYEDLVCATLFTIYIPIS